MPRPALTDDEIIGVLKRSNKINLVVEGPDESFIFRKIESLVDDVELIICDGAGTLKRIYDRRSEYPTTKAIYLSDKDINLFDSGYVFESGIVWTEGYSIENDMLCESRVFNLLDAEEAAKFDSDFALLIRWFDSEVENFLSGNSFKIDLHPTLVLSDGAYTPSFSHLHSRVTVKHIPSGREMAFLRGKNLACLLLKYLSHPERKSKFSRLNLLEISLMDSQTPFNAIVKEKLIQAKSALLAV